MNSQQQSLCTCGCCIDGKQLTPLSVQNAPGLSALHYRVGTHSSFKDSMMAALSKKEALDKLKSRYDDDMSIATLDAWSTVLDVLTFYQERIINEGYLRTAIERRSILEMARHISYIPRPGVAASTFLSFSMNEALGAPLKAVIPIGTKVQSIPEQDQLPQLFETVEEIEAKVEWNHINIQTKRKIIPIKDDTEIYLTGINTGLQPGDGLLMIGDERKNDPSSERWDFRKIQEVIPDNKAGFTKVTWEKGLGEFKNNLQTLPAKKNFKVYALKQRAFLFGYNAPEWRSMSKEVRNRFLGSDSSDTNTDKEWKNFDISSIAGAVENTIHLDALYPKIVKDSWLIVSTDAYQEVYKVKNVVESSRKEFTLTSKTMAIELQGENLTNKFNTNIRDAVIFAQSEELEIAERPVSDCIKNGQEIRLDILAAGLTEKKVIIIGGKRMRLLIPESADAKFIFKVENNITATRYLKTDDCLIILKQPEIMPDGKTKWSLKDDGGYEGTIESDIPLEPIEAYAEDEMVSELHTINSIKPGSDPTVIILKDIIVNYFDLATVLIYANVAKATHGETINEILGSGNGSKVFQKFELKQIPLTFVSASSSTGTATTLQIRVNDILWKEVPTFYGISSKEKVYTTSISDTGKVMVLFGDGITGSRLPTGTENIKATYRVGIGTAASVNAGQLSMLLSPQLGLNKVINPLAASGAEDPESFENTKHNAPLTVLTLDRIVSTKDFEDFTRAYAGIGKARAELLWSGEKQVVHITISAEDAKPVEKNSDLYKNLLLAIKAAGHSNTTLIVENFIPAYFTLNARIRVDSAYLFEDVKEKIVATLKDHFSFNARDFGQDVTPAEVIAIIQNVEGVLYTDLQGLNGIDPFAALTQFRVSAQIARWQGSYIIPAELLLINENEITITEITS